VRAPRASAIVLLIALGATAATTWGTYTVVRDQEDRLLNGRVSELNLLLTNSISAYPSTLSGQGGILKATKGSIAAFEQAAQTAATDDPAMPTYAWLGQSGDTSQFVVLAAVGAILHTGDVVSGELARAGAAALRRPDLVATTPFDPDRKLAFVMGPPATPAGTVIIRETVIGPVQAPRAAGSAPFNELDVAIYAGPTQAKETALAATTDKLPLHGDVRTTSLNSGSVHWLVAVKARHPLVGGVAANAWWVTLLVGLVGAMLLALVVETARRRRDAALALYASEHQVAETLQRSLLPQLPAIDGLDVAARYIAGSKGQEVGGDWFDVFPTAGEQVAITVGDVIGHDLAAASAMAQIRSAVRAYGVGGDQPRSVINRLDELVKALGLTQLATVVYGVLSPADADGSRVLDYTNAGHPAPLIRRADGRVEQLDSADSILIGAPVAVEHTQAQVRLEVGATLLLFTDGLIEEPGGSLDKATADVVSAFEQHGAAADLTAVCQRVIETTTGRELRDDIALLVIRIATSGRVAASAAGLTALVD
jgi:serine phosphatase RsbU (regulator of sigma subunit)